MEIRQRTGYLFLAVMLAQIILISAQVQTRTGGRVLEEVTFSVFSEIQRGVASAFGSVTTFWSRYVALRGLQAENEALREELAKLRVTLQQERAMAQRSAGLAALLELKASIQLPTVAAEVIGGDAIPGLHTVTINRGEKHGVRTNAAVISPAGVVGRVIGDVALHAARVQLLISPNAGAGVMIERTRAGGVVVSGGEGQPLVLEYVSNLADVKPGDLVVTAGTDGIYPKGFPVGRVESVQDGAGLYKDIRVRPVVDFSNVEEVLVVLGPPPRPEPPETAPGGRS